MSCPVAVLRLDEKTTSRPSLRTLGWMSLAVGWLSSATGQDIYTATREPGGGWSEPANLGAPVNTSAAETRPSLSWHAEQLLFGRAPGPEGMSDIYVATRER